MEREGEAAGGRVVAAHLVCLCCGGGWRTHWFGRIFLGRILGRNSLHTDRQTDRQTPTDDSLIISLYERRFTMKVGNDSFLQSQFGPNASETISQRRFL